MEGFHRRQGAGHDRPENPADHGRDFNVRAFVKIVQDTDNKRGEGTGPHTKEDPMVDPDNNLHDNPYHHPDEDAEEYVGKDDGFTHALGSACTHDLHDDDEHGAAQDERGKKDMQLRGKPGEFPVAQPQKGKFFELVFFS